MKTSGRLFAALAAICVFCLVAVPASHATQTLDRKDLVRQAKAAYYNLPSHGFAQLHASIVPDWEPMLKSQLQNATPDTVQRARDALNSLHFAISLDSAGQIGITHSLSGSAANEKMAKAFDQIFSGMEQAVKGVFATWSPFMLTSVFPAVDGDYKVVELGQQYLISYKDGDADVLLTMGKDLAIREVKVTTDKFTSLVWPAFTRTSQGLVISGYKAHYQSVAGNDTTELEIKIGNRKVDALEVPSDLNIDAVYNGSPYQIMLAFTDIQVHKKDAANRTTP